MPTTTTKSFQLKGSLFTLTVLQLIDCDTQLFNQELAQIVKQAPQFFQHAPIVIDLQLLSKTSAPVNYVTITSDLRKHGLIPIGIRGGTPDQQEAALAAELAVFALSKTTTIKNNDTDKNNAYKSAKIKPRHKEALQTKLITKPIRSGQQIYAKDNDLIVLSQVSPGAELLADGNIHVYGTLHGRALAGISGDQSARIFCQHLDAELVSIAGHYIVSEALLQQSEYSNHQIYLQEDKLHIKPLGISTQ